MGCCCGGDDIEEAMTSIEKKNRPCCTDLLGFLMLLAGAGFSGLIFWYSINQGADPAFLTRGVDVWGNQCGGANASTRPLAAWPNPAYYSVMVCVADCNETQSTTGYMIVPYATQQVINFCLPSPAAIAALGSNNAVTGTFAGAAQTFSRVIGDLQIAWPVMAAGTGAAMLVALIYVWLLKAVAGVLVWGSISLVLVGGAGFAYALITAGQNALNSATSSASTMGNAYLYSGYGMAGIVFIFFCVIVFLRERIRIAIQISKEAASAVVDMPGMQLFPVLPFVFLAVYAVWWVISCIYIASVQAKSSVPLEAGLAQINPFGLALPNPRVATTTDQRFQYLLAYQFFHLLWSVSFLQYWAFLVIAGAVADWYFTPWNADKSGKERGSDEGQLSNWPVLASLWRSFNHLGTVAVCSLLIAIVQFIRAAIAYIQAKSEGLGEDNSIVKYTKACVMCLLQCCFKCLECCLDKINKNGLIMTAIRGDNFCQGACSSFRLVWNNLARVAAINMVGTVLIAVGQVLVALGCSAGVAGFLLNVEPYKSTVSSILLPVLLVFVLSYFVAALFLAIFDASVDTIFICFLLDEERNGNLGRMLASENLQDIIAANSLSDEQKAKNAASKASGEVEVVKAS